jgi:tRNA(Ile)-lysidine synthase
MAFDSPALRGKLQKCGARIDSLVPTGEPVLAAVSGGADSLALLLLLRAWGRDVRVAHVHHGLRASADGDEEWVRQVCLEHQIPFVSKRVQVLAGAGEEARARQARYQALEEAAREMGCARIATGHTASDQLETVLLFWLRGASVGGLRGMEESRPAHGDARLLLVRPLLPLTHEECEALCRESGLEWREDESNSEGKYKRNRVRHELVPLLEKLMAPQAAPGQLARQTQRACELLGDDLRLLDSMADQRLREITTRREDGLLVLDGQKLACCDVALQRRVLRLAAHELEEREVSARQIEEVREWLGRNGRRRVWTWSPALRVEWTGESSGRRVRFFRPGGAAQKK